MIGIYFGTEIIHYLTTIIISLIFLVSPFTTGLTKNKVIYEPNLTGLSRMAPKKQYGDIEVTNQTNIDLKPVYSRIDLDKIRNKGNWQKGYDEGYKLWEQGNQLRKDGNLLEALELLDKARSVGYDAPALYNSYAMLFRKLKCYDDEILILLEAKERNEKLGSSVATAVTKWDERINRAMELRNP